MSHCPEDAAYRISVVGAVMVDSMRLHTDSKEALSAGMMTESMRLHTDSKEAPSAGMTQIVSMQRRAKGCLKDLGMQASAKIAQKKVHDRIQSSRTNVVSDNNNRNASTSSSSPTKNELASRSANAMRTWSLKRKDALVQDAMKLYALPESTVCLPATKGSRRASVGVRSSTHHRKQFSLSKYKFHLSGDTEDNLGALGPGSDRTMLSVYEATEELADANLSVATVNDLLHRFQNDDQDPKKQFTQEYLVAQNLYGAMTDHLRDLWISTVSLSEDVNTDISGQYLPGMDRLIEYSCARGEAIDDFESEMQRQKLSRWLKMCLNLLSDLNWEHAKLDFTKWIKSAHDNDAVLRDSIDHIGQHMDEVLNLLSISKYVCEEALGSHLVTAADELTKFYDEVRAWHEEAEERAKSRHHNRKSIEVALQNQRLQQLLSIAKEERERQRRNLEINSGLHQKMLQAMGIEPSKSIQKAGEEEVPDTTVRKQPGSAIPEMIKAQTISLAVGKLMRSVSRNRTVVVGGRVGGGAQHLMKPPSESAQVKIRPYAHIEGAMTRSIGKTRECLEVVIGCAKDREDHVESVVLAFKYARKLAKLKLRQERRSSALPAVHTIKESDLKLEVRAQPLVMPVEGVVFSEHRWDDDDIQQLLRRKKELSDELNSISLPVSLAGVWGSLHSLQVKKGAQNSHGVRHKVTPRRDSLSGLRRKSSERRPSLASGPGSPRSRRPSDASRFSSELRSYSRHSSDDSFEGVVDECSSLDGLLKTLVAMEAEDVKRARKLTKANQENGRLFLRTQRRWGEICVYSKQDQLLWFKTNARQPLVESLLKDCGQALSSGTLLLGRIGEYQLKELQSELKNLIGTLQQETEERNRCIGAKIPFDEAAWHFRIHFPLEMLINKFGPIWKGLKDRISFGSKLLDDHPQAHDLEAVEGADKKFQEHMSLQSQLRAAEMNAKIRGDLVASIIKEGERLEVKREFLSKMLEQSSKLEDLRSKVGGMRLIYKDIQKRLIEVVTELKSITGSMARHKEKQQRKSTSHADESRVDRFMTDRPWGDQENLELHHQSESARRAQEMLKFLQDKLQSNIASTSFATPLFRSKGSKRRRKKKSKFKIFLSQQGVFHCPKEKIKEMADQMRKAEAVLKGRLEQKRKDLRRFIEVIGDHIIVPKTKEELEAQWKSEMQDMHRRLRNLARTKHFWEDRLNHWYGDVSSQYGKSVTIALEDHARHESVRGNSLLETAISHSFAAKETRSGSKGQLQGMGISGKGQGPTGRRAMQSLVFEQAIQTLTEIDSMRQRSDMKRISTIGTAFLTIEGNANLPPEMKEQAHRIRTTLENDSALLRMHQEQSILPSLPCVFGRGRKRSTHSGHLFRSHLGRSLKRGATIRDRVMTIFAKATDTMEVGGDDTVTHFRPDLVRKKSMGLGMKRASRMSVSSMRGSALRANVVMQKKANRLRGVNRPSSGRPGSGRPHSPRPRTLDDFLSVSGSGRLSEFESGRRESELKQNQDHRESYRGSVTDRRFSSHRTTRQSIAFQYEGIPEDGIYNDDGSSSDSDIIEKARQTEPVGDPRQFRKQSTSSTRSRPMSAGSSRSDGRYSVISSTSTKSRRGRDGMDMDEDIGRLKALRKRRRKKAADTDASEAGRVNMLRLFMDDAQASEQEKPKIKSTRFKQRASVIGEMGRRGDRRATKNLLQDIRNRRSQTHRDSRMKRRSDKRLDLAESRRSTIDIEISMGLTGTTALRKDTITKSGPQQLDLTSKPTTDSDSDSDSDMDIKSEKLTRRTLKVESLACNLEGDDESDVTSRSSSSSASSRNIAELDEVIRDLEEERVRRESVGNPKNENYSSLNSVPQLGLRLLRNCRDRILQEFISFEKAYDRAVAHGLQRRKGRHRSSTLHTSTENSDSSAKEEELLTADGFIWLAARLGYGEDDARAIFDHLTFAAGAETVSTEVITEGDEEHGPSVTRDGFLSALRTALPLNNMVQLRVRLQQRYGHSEDLFDIAADGAEVMTLAAFCTLCESVGAIAKEATPLFHQMELHNEIPPDHVGGISQVTKRAFILSLRHAEALIAARRMIRRLATMAHMTDMKAFDRSETNELSASGIHARSSVFHDRGSDAKQSSSPEGSEHDGDGGPFIHMPEKAVSWYHLFVNSVDKRYHDQPLSLDAMRAAVKTFVPFKEDVRLLFRLAQRHTQSGGMRARIQELALRALGGFGHTCKVLADTVGYDMTVNQSHRTGQRYKASANMESARLAARQNQKGNVSDLELSAGFPCASGEASDEFFDDRFHSSGPDIDMVSFQERCAHTQSALLREAMLRRSRRGCWYWRRGKRPETFSIESPASTIQTNHKAKATKTARVPKTRHAIRRQRPLKQPGERQAQLRARTGAQPKFNSDKPPGDEDANSEDDEDTREADASQEQEISKDQNPRKRLHWQESFGSRAMRKKSVIDTETASKMKQEGLAAEFGQSGEIAELKGGVPDEPEQQKGEDLCLPRVPVGKDSTLDGRRQRMPSLEEDQNTVKGKISAALQFGRTATGSSEQLGGTTSRRGSKDREVGTGLTIFDNFALGGALPSSSEGEELTKRAARPGAVRKANTFSHLKRSATTTEDDTSLPKTGDAKTPKAGESLERRRLRHGTLTDASRLHVSAKETEDDGDLWKWKQDPNEVGSLSRRYPTVGDILPNTGSTPELTEVRPDSSASVGSSPGADAKIAEGSVSRGSLEGAQQFSKERQAIEQREGDRHRKRLDLFGGDDLELQIATQRLQDCRTRLLMRFRSMGKAFEVLAGSRDANLVVASLRTKVEKVIAFNPLDAQRLVTVLSAVQDTTELSYNDFLHVMRFAKPVHSILEFRTRLVERYCQIECAFRVLGFTEKVQELDVGLFERPMLGAGIVSNDAHRLFRVADAAQPGGPCGYLSVEGLRFAVDHAHVLAWLEAFYVRVAAAKGRSGQSVHDAVAGAGLQDATVNSEASTGNQNTKDEPIATAGAFQLLLANLEFPAELAVDTFAFLQRRSRQVTLAAFAGVLHHAFGADARRQGTAGRSMNQKQASAMQSPDALKLGLKGKASAKANAWRTFGDLKPAAKTASQMSAGMAPHGFLASGNAPGPSDGSATIAASTAAESQAASMHVTEDVREAALVQTRRLRRYTITHFANYQEAYRVFNRKSALHGVALDEWMEAMEAFGFSDAVAWEQIFGLIIDWQHLRWDPRYRGTEGRVTLARLANALDHAAPCTTPVALRKLLQEKYGTMQKAWIHLSGREGAEELSVSVWQQAMHKIAVVAEDAGHLHAVLRAAPISERAPDNHNLQLSRVAFLSAMRSAEAVTRLFQLMWRVANLGSISCAFEGRIYPLDLLSVTAFEEQLAEIVQVTEARLLFAYLDVNQEGLVSICDLMDALTIMQATYFPYAPHPGSHAAAEQHRELFSHTVADASTPLPSTIRDIASTTPSSTAISPSDVKGRSSSGLRSHDSSFHQCLQNVSTALPDSIISDGSEDGSEDMSLGSVQRPWTSMSVVGGSAQPPGSSAEVARSGGSALGFATGFSSVRAGSISHWGSAKHGQGAFTHAPFLPHLDLATVHRVAAVRRSVQHDNPLYGREEVDMVNNLSQSVMENSTCRDNGLDASIEDQRDITESHCEVAASSERTPMTPRPHSEVASSSNQDRSSLAEQEESSANIPRPRSEMGTSTARSRTSQDYVRRGSPVARAQTPNASNPLHVARASVAAARGARPSSELGMARRRSPTTAPRATSSHDEVQAQQSMTSALPALGGARPKAKPEHGATGKRSSTGTGSRKSSSGRARHASPD